MITLVVSLFVVMRSFELAGAPERWVEWMNACGLNFANPIVLTVVGVLVSYAVSNVPATRLLSQPLTTNPELWYVLPPGATFAGNLILIGSIANLIYRGGAGGTLWCLTDLPRAHGNRFFRHPGECRDYDPMGCYTVIHAPRAGGWQCARQTHP